MAIESNNGSNNGSNGNGNVSTADRQTAIGAALADAGLTGEAKAKPRASKPRASKPRASKPREPEANDQAKRLAWTEAKRLAVKLPLGLAIKLESLARLAEKKREIRVYDPGVDKADRRTVRLRNGTAADVRDTLPVATIILRCPAFAAAGVTLDNWRLVAEAVTMLADGKAL